LSFKILVSAGEASGDRYAARLTEALRCRIPEAEFFGCTGPEMRRSGVRTIVDASQLAVVGLVEVVRHIPRIYGEYRRLTHAAADEKPQLAILTDSPDFHLRLAARLCEQRIPVFYLVAPQAWAWREGRVGSLRRNVEELHCIFPFEEQFFRSRGVAATYIGHPLSRMVRAGTTRQEFFNRHGLPEANPMVCVCPGSRRGELERHLPVVAAAASRIRNEADATPILALPAGCGERWGEAFFERFNGGGGMKRIEGETWDALAHCDVSLLASGTVTIEGALLHAPMVTFYKVNPFSWLVGRRFVRAPYLAMANLVAGKPIVPELIQNDATPERIAAEAVGLLRNTGARARMAADLDAVASILRTPHDPLEYSADRIVAWIKRN
jgi:lipid-A-disaccharide synthase